MWLFFSLEIYLLFKEARILYKNPLFINRDSSFVWFFVFITISCVFLIYVRLFIVFFLNDGLLRFCGGV